MRGGEQRFLRVKNFERMQHYKDRRPPWVKLYVDLLEDRELASLPWEARLLYPLLLCVAGLKDNRFPANPVWIAEEIKVPLGPTRKGLASLLDSGHLLALSLADIDGFDASPRARTRVRGETETETEKTLLPDKPATERKERKPDLLWDALVAEVGEPRTSSERGRTNKALKELRDVGATPADVRSRCETYRTRWPGIDLTATALAANWSTFAVNGGRPVEDASDRVQRLMAERGL